MDNLTHSLVGALIGQAGLKRKTGLAMPALIIGANLPDVDAACFLWLDGLEHLAFRRGITHGPIAWVLLPLLLAGALWWWDRWQTRRGTRPDKRLPVHFGWLYALAFLACLTHPALDWLNVYGIRLLEPFSSRWFYGDVLFIIDIWLWALLGGATWFSLRREKRGGEWKEPARIALGVAVLYVIVNFVISRADATLNASFATTISSPPPLTFWERESIGEDGAGGFYIDDQRLGDCDVRAATAGRRNNRDLAAFLFWSRAPFAERAPDGSVLIRDARFTDPRARDRFTVELKDVRCEPVPTSVRSKRVEGPPFTSSGALEEERCFDKLSTSGEGHVSQPQIVWLRRDLRLADQPALHAAAQAGPVIPVFVLDDAAAGDHAYGGASRWWLHHSLESLSGNLGKHRSRIVLRRGDAAAELAKIAKETGASAVHAVRHYEPWWRMAQTELKRALPEACELCLHDGNYLAEPGSVTTGSGGEYKIYTPFSKVVLERMPPRDELPAPNHIAAPEKWPKSDDLADWKLLPTRPDWSGGMRDFWDVGEAAAHKRLEEWAGSVADYDLGRNLPSQDGSSRLSPHLHWGEISPVEVWHHLSGHRGNGWQTFAKELIWRDYAQQTIAQFPHYPSKSYRDGYTGLWRSDNAADADFVAWAKGQTGYPIVDAGMRQLWQTGWMHNRVRMITASFLVKHLLIDWTRGEQWFWDCLVDADYGNNGVNWQWISGTGVDSNMFVRIMAPLTQSEKFDAAGYIRTYVPELAKLSDADIHDPPEDSRGDYPLQIIGHREGRERALSAYRKAKG